MTHAMGDAVRAEPTPSKGLGWATAVLIFMLAELSIYAGIDGSRTTDAHRLMILGMMVVIGIQALGIWFTWTGRYKLGGNLQIAASLPHVIDLMGIIGIIGGVLSRRYPDRLAELSEE